MPFYFDLRSYFTATLFCGVDVSPFIGALAVGIIMLVATILLPLFIDRVRTGSPGRGFAQQLDRRL